jgi:hypothetical protein
VAAKTIGFVEYVLEWDMLLNEEIEVVMLPSQDQYEGLYWHIHIRGTQETQ